ncbi:unnamed protein product [Paramecium primaurelia]|uniref:Uncharacterized protein n=1 Tax=Paramecium primaurelia TaxID=5886 RepID=A0A8S1JVS6_PARPR|nr:unnamed protein product [Paramecium primaurelia]
MKSQQNQQNRNYLIKHLQLIKEQIKWMILFSTMQHLKEIKNQYNIYYKKEHHLIEKIRQRNLMPIDVTDDQEIKLMLESK